MPEAAMNEDNSVPARKDKAGFTRKVFAVKPETVAHRVSKAADGDLGFGVPAADGAHVRAAAGRRNLVHGSHSKIGRQVRYIFEVLRFNHDPEHIFNG
jgi:hypothetical protein